jgi:Bifunctional DNA primase/polymerase, N-terminal
MNYKSQYKKYKWSLVRLKPGTKRPVNMKWATEAQSDGYGDGSVGLKHAYSRTCCFDIDQLGLFREKHPEEWELIKHGLQYTSGKDDRLKIIFRTPKGMKLYSKVFISGTGEFRCFTNTDGSTQDVLPPTKLKDGRQYEWLSELPARFKDIPLLPKVIAKELKLGQRRQRSNGGKRYSSHHLSPYVIGYNEWFRLNGGSLRAEVLKTGGYYERKYGFNRYGSSSGSVNIMLFSDANGEFGVNFSPVAPTAGKQIPHLGFDPYDLLVVNKFQERGMTYKEAELLARKYVTTDKEIRQHVNAAFSTLHPINAKQGEKKCKKFPAKY